MRSTPYPIIIIIVNRQSSAAIIWKTFTSFGKSSPRSTSPCHQSAGNCNSISLFFPLLPLCESTYRTCEQPWQTTTVFACEKTVVIVKQPGHLTSMKKERGAGTRVLSLCFLASLRQRLASAPSRCGRGVGAYAAGVGLRRSTAST